MATVLLTPSCSFSTFNHPLLPNLPSSRNQTKTSSNQKKCRLREKFTICSRASTKPTSPNVLCRRDLVLFGLSASVASIFPSLGSGAEEELKMVSLVDDINAYSYLYPVELPSKKFFFKCIQRQLRNHKIMKHQIMVKKHT
uniref:Uncharacterized protein n=1 Tax=Davidia involucrata TaxID=16924 RepID=A0A5B7B4R4_DAVIN